MNTLNTDILKCVAFDLDGTIYFGSRQLAPRAQEVKNLGVFVLSQIILR